MGTEEYPFSQRWSPRTRLGVTRRAAIVLSAIEEIPPQRETMALIGRELPTVTGARSCLPASGAERDRRVKWRGNRCGVCD